MYFIYTCFCKEGKKDSDFVEQKFTITECVALLNSMFLVVAAYCDRKQKGLHTDHVAVCADGDTIYRKVDL